MHFNAYSGWGIIDEDSTSYKSVINFVAYGEKSGPT